MSDKKEEKRNPAHIPWSIILAAGQISMTAEERGNYDDRLRYHISGGSPSINPGDINIDKVPWFDED